MPIGRALRFLLGAWLVALTFSFYGSADRSATLMTFGMVLGLFVLYAPLHFLFWHYLQRLNPYLGAFFMLGSGGVPGRVALLTHLGVSFLLAAVRADPGCEVMAIPGLTFKKYTHLAYICFSPIDWMEAKIYRYIRGAGGARMAAPQAGQPPLRRCRFQEMILGMC